ncbi:hypothetical protein ACG3SL_13340 [Sphingomonas sp. CJ20]
MTMAPPGIRRIVFTGDFLRPAEFSERPTQHFNIRWLADLVGAQIAAAVGLPIAHFFWCAEGLTEGQIDTAGVRAFYAALGHEEVSIGAWAQIVELPDLPPVAAAYLDGIFADALVIGFEMPDFLLAHLERRGTPYINCSIHPIRFLDDIFLGFVSNHAGIRQALAHYALSDEEIAVGAGLTRAAAGRMFRFPTDGNTALLVGQVASDRTQVRDGRFYSFVDFAEPLLARLRDFDDVLIKEHPLDRHNPGVRFLEGASIRVRRVEDNIYSLLSVANLSTVITLSSSVGIEAPYFGKRTEFLLRSPMRLYRPPETPAQGDYIGIFDAFLSPDFWRTVLDPLAPAVRVSKPSGYRVPPKPNRLRISLASFWGFDTVDFKRETN